MILLEIPKLNQNIIELQKNKQSCYRLIYRLKLVELETLKIYIKINLDNRFIWHFKSFIITFIFFFQKLNASFYLYINYKNPNNLTIKNLYLLLPIKKFLN